MLTPVTSVPRTVLTYGRFDLFHQGHVALLREAARLGSDLIVGCMTDELAARLGQTCERSYATRRMTLEKCRFVSRVIPLQCQAQLRTDIVNYDVCILAARSDSSDIPGDVQDIAQVYLLSGSPKPPSSAQTGAFSQYAVNG